MLLNVMNRSVNDTFRTGNSSRGCGLRTECRREADSEYFEKLFGRAWEVFVIRRDPETGKYGWQTLCCAEPSC